MKTRSPSSTVGRIEPVGTSFQSATADRNEPRTSAVTRMGSIHSVQTWRARSRRVVIGNEDDTGDAKVSKGNAQLERRIDPPGVRELVALPGVEGGNDHVGGDDETHPVQAKQFHARLDLEPRSLPVVHPHHAGAPADEGRRRTVGEEPGRADPEET